MSIGVPGLTMYFEHDEVKPFVKKQVKKLRPAVAPQRSPEKRPTVVTSKPANGFSRDLVHLA
jgi:hypothetical protein